MKDEHGFDDIEDVFDYLEDNFAQPVRLPPPGDCAWFRHGLLQRHVRSACEGSIGCGVLRKRSISNVQCANARGAINRERLTNAEIFLEDDLVGDDSFLIRN